MELPYENFAAQQKRYNQIQMDAKKFLVYGTMLRPPQFYQTPVLTTLEHWYSRQDLGPITAPAVDRATWRSPDGSIGLAILNIDSNSQTASFDVNDLIGGLNLHSVELITADGIQIVSWPGPTPGVVEVNIPAYDAVVVAFHTTPVCDGNMYPELHGDIDNNCYVDMIDFSLLTAEWLDSSSVPCPELPGDLSGDCTVNMVDLEQLVQNWLKCTDPHEPCYYEQQ